LDYGPTQSSKWKFRRAGVLLKSELRIYHHKRRKMDMMYIDKCPYEIWERKTFQYGIPTHFEHWSYIIHTDELMKSGNSGKDCAHRTPFTQMNRRKVEILVGLCPQNSTHMK
jgi:hypothetical protein